MKIVGTIGSRGCDSSAGLGRTFCSVRRCWRSGTEVGAGWRFGQTRVERSKDERRRSRGLIYEHKRGGDECRISEKGLGSEIAGRYGQGAGIDEKQ